jgi:SAM-dependent methyltransferase
VSTTVAPAPVARVYAEALRGDPCHVVGLHDEPAPLPVRHWRRTADASDRALLAHCVGTVIDIGCGPGRMSEHLQKRGRPVLAVDVVAEAVSQARARGVLALRRDVFRPLPGEGRWDTALLADGNIGIGGDPAALLARVRELLAPSGRVVADLAPPGHGIRCRRVRLAGARGSSEPFAWAVVGADAVAVPAREAGLRVAATHEYDGRWFAVLAAG